MLIMEPEQLTQIGVVYERGYFASPFLFEFAKTFGYNGLKVVLISKKDYDSINWKGLIVGNPSTPMCAESLSKISIECSLKTWQSLAKFLISLSDKTTDVQVLIIDSVDLYFEDNMSAGCLLALLKTTVNTFHFKLIVTLTEESMQYNHLIETILIPDRVVSVESELSNVYLKDISQLNSKTVLKYSLNSAEKLKFVDLTYEIVDYLVEKITDENYNNTKETV